MKTLRDILYEAASADPCCGPNILTQETSDDEMVLAQIIHWVRNRKKDLKYCIRNNIMPGPKGHLTRKRIWMPDPLEGCDAEVKIETLNIKKKCGYDFNPYAWRNHCCTLQHCVYLVKIQPSFVMRFFKNVEATTQLESLIRLMRLGDIPVLIGHKVEWVRDFAHDACRKGQGFSPANRDHPKVPIFAED